jgi:hypothetical protein
VTEACCFSLRLRGENRDRLNFSQARQQAGSK